ncbi:hypothetical protein [Pseudanabaena sp. UWO310]|uniref:hypothetical protein n=1 Tax=Pseudanabaena sp. UWO310 TaxID=2480795 RepID=UPI001CC1FCB7|nr:hypothetical protein [Pseudanabaena sp. UWO310]
MRKIAQKTGVSHNASYLHFAYKEAVPAAIALEGFRLLSGETVYRSMRFLVCLKSSVMMAIV